VFKQLLNILIFSEDQGIQITYTSYLHDFQKIDYYITVSFLKYNMKEYITIIE